jgi:hypothetical protein
VISLLAPVPASVAKHMARLTQCTWLLHTRGFFGQGFFTTIAGPGD